MLGSSRKPIFGKLGSFGGAPFSNILLSSPVHHLQVYVPDRNIRAEHDRDCDNSLVLSDPVSTRP